jgi:chemotaxis protein methyltransferase WspC
MSLRSVIEDATGLALSAATVERAVRERLPRAAPGDCASYAPRPGSGEFDALLDLLVVPESWLFRDPAVFEEALGFVQRRLAARSAAVRILSVPCAGGEEPYSMAMALMDAGIPPARCRIDAFDLSHAAIARAHAGRYGRNAFRAADLAFRARHFTQSGDDWVIGAGPRAYVSFAQANLFALDGAALAGRYDLVFCRNLLIYFDAAARERAARALHGMLADDGLLLSGYAEAPAFCRHGFAPDLPRSLFALRKQDVPGAPASLVRDTPTPEPVPEPARTPRRAATRIAATPRDRIAQARRLADGGRLAEAGDICRALLARLPDLADAWFLLGLIDEACGRPQAAERCWRRCVYLDPEHYDALCSLALLHEQLGDGVRGASFRQRAARIFAQRSGDA